MSEDILILLTGLFIALVRMIRRRGKDRLVDLVPNVLYYGVITYYIYYCFLRQALYLWGIALICAMLLLCVFALPCIICRSSKIMNNRAVIWMRSLHQDTIQGFTLWGLLMYGIMYNIAQGWHIVFVLAAYIVSAVYRLTSAERRQSVNEMHDVQGISFIAGIAISYARFDVNIKYHPFYVLLYTMVMWIILMVVYSLNQFDSNKGTTWELLTRNIRELCWCDIRWKRMLKRFVNLFIPVCALTFSLFIENTLEFYYTNRGVFGFQISDFLGSMIVRVIILTVSLSVILTCLSSKATKITGALASGIAAASYLQIMIFDRDIGITDTYVIDWSQYSGKMIINSIIWIAVIIIPVAMFLIWKEKAFRVIKWVVFCILLVQLSAAVSLVYKSGGYHNTAGQISDYDLTDENEFTVSADSNIIVFVLDTFSSDYLDMMLEKYPDALSGLNDFTYYNNYDCKYDGTALAMNYLLSGKEFDNTIPCKEYSRQAFESESAGTFYGYMKEHGYTCNLYTDKDTGKFLGLGNLYGLYDNVDKKNNNHIEKDRNAIQGNMLRGALYRMLPLAVKRYSIVVTADFDDLVYSTDENDSPAALDDNFYEKLDESGIDINEEQGTFNIFHFKGMHDYGYGSKRANIPERAESCLQDVCRYIDKLKQLGVYDSSTIIITADHGQHETIDGIQPVFFIKRKDARQDALVINNAPVSAEEFLPTILKAAGASGDMCGSTIDDFKENEVRERTVYVRKYNYDDVAGLLRSNINYSSYSMLYGYTYKGDKEDLRKKDEAEPDIKLTLTDFWQ